MNQINKYLYTVSDRGKMYNELMISINSLLRFVDPSRILIVHTPDINHYCLRKLENMNIVNVLTHNELKPFNISKNNKQSRLGYYGEKIAKLNVLHEENNVMFLDCDTVIKDNVNKLFSHDFDVAIRIDKAFTEFNINNWVKQFNDLDLICLPMVNTGVMLFKNGYHKIICKYAKEYYNNIEWLDFHKESQFIDQYAITCAISKCLKEFTDFKVWWLDDSIHGMRWESDINPPYIKHGSRKRVFRKIIRKMQEYVYYVS